MHRTHAGHGSIWPAEAVEAHASLDAAERASRAREDALREAAALLDLTNGDILLAAGEMPASELLTARAVLAWRRSAILALINKPKGGDANDKSKERTRDPATSPGVTAGASAGWQPIETAPRDGREILVYDPIVQITFCVRWTGARFPWTLVFGYREFSERSPSHWMPLPAAPVDGGEDA
jgi:hypothetical protein